MPPTPAPSSPPWNPAMSYVGFWARGGASLIDGVLVAAVTLPPLVAIYGWEYFDGDKVGFLAGPADLIISWIVPIFLTLGFWEMKQATPGKMAVRARIVDAATGAPPRSGSTCCGIWVILSQCCRWVRATSGRPSMNESRPGMTRSRARW